MTFLQLCVFLRQECEIPGTGPTAVTSQVGQLKRVVDWIIAAWEEIQLEHDDWRWMRRNYTIATSASDGIYASGNFTDVDASATIANFGKWLMDDQYDPPLSYLTASGVAAQYHLTWTDWNQFKWLYRRGTQTNGKPVHISVDPADNVVLGPVPDASYTITGDFQRSPQILAASGDIPQMPTEYHKLIAYWAMEKYAANSVAPELVARAQYEAGKLMSALERRQRPQISVGPPLL